jgi:signal transduction histidine kinase
MKKLDSGLPARLIGLAAIAVLLVTALLVWSGWRVLEHERLLSDERYRQHLETAADRVASTLFRGLSRFETELNALAGLSQSQRTSQLELLTVQLPEDAVIVLFEPGAVQSYPSNRLAYYPIVSSSHETEHDFQRIDLLEFRQKDYSGAIDELRRVSTRDDPRVRAAALVRLARNYVKAGKMENALEALEELVGLGNTPVESVPASLLGRYSQCALLQTLDRSAEREIRLLNEDLQRGFWTIDRATYLFYDQQLKDWLGSKGDQPQPSSAPAHVLASATSELWSSWQLSRQTGNLHRGYRTAEVVDVPILTLVVGSSDLGLGIVAGAEYLHEWILQPLKPLQNELNVALKLLDNEGSEFLSLSPPATQGMETVRTPLETGLPWTLVFTIADATVFDSDLMFRRTLIVSGIFILLIGFIGSVFFMARALAREMEAARLKSDFVAAVSHEFRTPLTSLRQFTELLATDRMPNEADRQSCYRVLQHETGRLHRLVENLLDFAKMEANALQYRIEEADAYHLVASVVSEFEQEATSQGYSVSLTLSESDLRVKADQEALSRAIWNLLDNAVKYSPECKTIEIDVESEEDCGVIRVKDQGLGIPVEEQERVFTRFSRGTSSKQVSSKGTGLGLPMVRRIVEDHGGRIELQSEVGEGSTFSIFLPRVY